MDSHLVDKSMVSSFGCLRPFTYHKKQSDCLMISCVPAALCKLCLTLHLFVPLLVVWSTMFRSICGLIYFHLSVQRQLLQTSWSIFVRPLLARACMGRASQEIKREDVPNKLNGFNTSLLQANQDFEPTPPSTTVAQTPA